MALTKTDKNEVKDIVGGEVGKLVKSEIVDAIHELVIPAIDRVYKELRDFKADTKRNFADVERQINDLKIDTPSKKEFLGHEDRIHKLEYELGFV